MARVVMLTAAAGPGLDLQYGDIFETDQATADRLLAGMSAREVTPEDKDAPVKRENKGVLEAASRGAAETQSEDAESGEVKTEDSDEAATEEAPPVAPAPRRAASRRR